MIVGQIMEASAPAVDDAAENLSVVHSSVHVVIEVLHQHRASTRRHDVLVVVHEAFFLI